METWTDLQINPFCYSLLGFVCFIPEFVIDLGGSNESAMNRCLPSIFQKVFQQLHPNTQHRPTQCIEKFVKLSVYHPDGEDLIENESNGIAFSSSRINSCQINRLVELLFSIDETRINDLESAIMKNDITTFEIISFINHYPLTYFPMVK
jgi:hypothetical protein